VAAGLHSTAQSADGQRHYRSSGSWGRASVQAQAANPVVLPKVQAAGGGRQQQQPVAVVAAACKQE